MLNNYVAEADAKDVETNGKKDNPQNTELQVSQAECMSFYFVITCLLIRCQLKFYCFLY